MLDGHRFAHDPLQVHRRAKGRGLIAGQGDLAHSHRLALLVDKQGAAYALRARALSHGLVVGELRAQERELRANRGHGAAASGAIAVE